MITYSSAKFKGSDKAFMTIKVRDAADSTKLHTFLKVVEGASDAGLVTRRFEEAESSPVAPTAGCVIGRVALLTLKDDNGQLYKVTVPGVKLSLVEDHPTQPKNQILNATQCTAIANAYATCTGKTSVSCIASRIHQYSYKG